MNADDRIPGQQGLDGQTPQGRQPAPQPGTAGQADGGMSTGQASYGNSGDTGSETLDPNGSSLGQESDEGQSGETGEGRETRLFSGTENDLGSAGTGRSGIAGSVDDPNRSNANLGGSTGRSGIEGSLDAEDQSFADQGQGAMSGDAMGSAEKGGTTDIDTERAHSRDGDIEGSSL
ncbi:hypothetical protein GGQ97_002739 [Sphingomonas kaistensis]|uniref:Uncharacterized protein n=1 Tax=Sphingomonas kaistensis TaxID=298708 RepID=A0A7X5Y8H3_9SPHN|nr:hypothetical protein [Sphingomonas kaistensis]NJC06946.1 hypothetical protein [Sphingomonas kaistensis]